MKNRDLKINTIGSTQISMLDETEKHLFFLGLIEDVKDYFKNPMNLKAYEESKAEVNRECANIF